MDVNDLHPADDYSHRFFIWHEWLQVRIPYLVCVTTLHNYEQANGPLTTENVFDYFATSMFYDKQSNNQVLRMQTMHTGQPILNEAEELRYATKVPRPLSNSHKPVDDSRAWSSLWSNRSPLPCSSYRNENEYLLMKVRGVRAQLSIALNYLLCQ